MPTETVPRRLRRFRAAQRRKGDGAIAAEKEVRNKAKVGHWAHHMLPQYKGLGKSERSTAFAVRSIDEAKAYLADRTLYQNSKRFIKSFLEVAAKDPNALETIFAGHSIDKLKLQASLTLLAIASPPTDRFFSNALFQLFGNEPDGPAHAQSIALLEDDGVEVDLSTLQRRPRSYSVDSHTSLSSYRSSGSERPSSSSGRTTPEPFSEDEYFSASESLYDDDVAFVIKDQFGKKLEGYVFRMIEDAAKKQLRRNVDKDTVRKNADAVAKLANSIFKDGDFSAPSGDRSARRANIARLVTYTMEALLTPKDRGDILNDFDDLYTEILKSPKRSDSLRSQTSSTSAVNTSHKTGGFSPLTYHPDTRNACEKLNQENIVFAFGSNLKGVHGSGAAERGFADFDATWGKGVGPQGNSYAIPTLKQSAGGNLPLSQNQLKLSEIESYVNDFLEYARSHPERTIFVTRVGAQIAGFSDEQMAKLFIHAPTNCSMPEPWREIINRERQKIATEHGIRYQPDTLPPATNAANKTYQ